MKKVVVGAGLLALIVAGVVAYNRSTGEPGAAAGAPGAGGGFGRAGGNGARPVITVELASATRDTLIERITVVGNLIGAATVEVVPKVSGRLHSINVQLGDPVRRGQIIARIEDQEVREQVKQAEASFQVASATVRQREADLKFAGTNLDRSHNLYERQLLPRQTLDDAEARHQAAAAQLDLAQAQFAQARSRLEELRIQLTDTNIPSPVDGFVGRRRVDPGAFVGPNAPLASVVDIRLVRLVANIVERDLHRLSQGLAAAVEVDAYPGEPFEGRIARIAPVLDPATRTAEIEVEIPNRDFRLKPGMYARVQFVVDRRENALVVPRNALIDIEGKRAIFLADEANTVRMTEVTTGLEERGLVEVLAGLTEGARIVTTGAGALQDGDRIIPAGTRGRGEAAGAGGGPNRGQVAAAPAGGPPPSQP